MIKTKPTDDFSPYVAERAAGATPEQVLAAMRRDGLDGAARMRGIRVVFGLAGGQARLDAQRGAVLRGLAPLASGG